MNANGRPKIGEGWEKEQRKRRKKAKAARREGIYAPFRVDGASRDRLSAFAYPLEKAQRVFADLLASDPRVQLELVQPLGHGDAVRDIPVPGLRSAVTRRMHKATA